MIPALRPLESNPLGWLPAAFVAWAVIFGTYEIIERTLLQGASPSLLHILHIIRGTMTSFLLAGLAVWYQLRRGIRSAPPPVPAPGLPVVVAETEARELETQVTWIARLRWAAIGAVTVTALLSHYLFGVITAISLTALLLIVGTMVLYNAFFISWRRREPAGARLAFSEVFLDLAALTLMLCFTGGIHNPFFLFYMFHIVIAGILLRRTETYIVTAGACVFFSGLVILQKGGVLPSYPLLIGVNQAPLEIVTGWFHVFGILAAFVLTACCTAYFTTTIVIKLRRRGAEIVRAGEVVAQERAKMDDIVRSVRAAMVIVDLHDRIVWANQTASEWFGGELVGRFCHETLWGEGREEGASHHSPAPLHALSGPATQERKVTRNGHVSFYLVSYSPIRDAEGRIGQVLELIQDITASKEMQMQLTQASKMVAVGELAAGIAHEINNPLAVIASSAEILAESFREGDLSEGVVLRHLERIESHVFRCKAIIQNLLSFARRDDGRFEEVTLPSLLEDTIQLVEGSSRARERQIVRDFSADPSVTIQTHPHRLQQVVLNLLLNSMDATPAGGRITVSAVRTPEGAEIAVADTGHGIPPEHRSRIFEPFFTTKSVGKGTGLGLYLCHRFVKSLGGQIGFEDRKGGGTVFRVRLPARLPAEALADEAIVRLS